MKIFDLWFRNRTRIVASIALLVAVQFYTAQAANATCTKDQSDALQSAYSTAHTQAKKAFPFVGNNSTYTAWFGTWTVENEAFVKKTLGNVIAATLVGAPEFLCDDGSFNECMDKRLAYVFSDAPFKIYICEEFWVSEQDYDVSKASTMVHEIAHFYLKDSGDYCYGAQLAGCADLAINFPDRAIKNADNYRLFTETAP